MYSEQVYLNWIFRIVLATLCGCAIGYERTSRNKSAGIRTHAIIALGSSMFMIISKYAFFDVSTADGARVAAQIVSGIGFLGAGVIFVKDDLIQGLTTAAGMWTTSGIAACIGAGLIFIGVFATLFLVVLQKIFHYPFFNQIDHPNVLIQTNIVSDKDEIYKIFEKYGIEVNEIKMDKNLDLMTFDTNNRWIDHKNELFQDLMSIDTVTKNIYSLIDKETMADDFDDVNHQLEKLLRGLKIMKIKDVIECLKNEGTWVRWNRCTRDRVLFGDDDQEVKKIGVCWVATNKVIEQALKKGINFIISHENIFYTTGTHLETKLVESIEHKKDLLSKGNICVYRCHDVWDSIPEYGVSDVWAKKLGFDFRDRVINSYYQYADIPKQTVSQLAKHVANVLKDDGEDGVYVFGDVNKEVSHLAIGTGAGTDIFEMLEFNPDVVIVADDGITNYKDAQYAIDNDLPMIVVNHAGCEIGGLKNMVNYFNDKLPDLDVEYLEEGFHISYFK